MSLFSLLKCRKNISVKAHYINVRQKIENYLLCGMRDVGTDEKVRERMSHLEKECIFAS